MWSWSRCRRDRCTYVHICMNILDTCIYVYVYVYTYICARLSSLTQKKKVLAFILKLQKDPWFQTQLQKKYASFSHEFPGPNCPATCLRDGARQRSASMLSCATRVTISPFCFSPKFFFCYSINKTSSLAAKNLFFCSNQFFEDKVIFFKKATHLEGMSMSAIFSIKKKSFSAYLLGFCNELLVKRWSEWRAAASSTAARPSAPPPRAHFYAWPRGEKGGGRGKSKTGCTQNRRCQVLQRRGQSRFCAEGKQARGKVFAVSSVPTRLRRPPLPSPEDTWKRGWAKTIHESWLRLSPAPRKM